MKSTARIRVLSACAALMVIGPCAHAQVRAGGSSNLAARDAASAAEGAARAQLADWLSRRTEAFRIELASAPAPGGFPDGEFEFAARPVAAGQPTPRMVVWLDARVQGRFVRALPVVYHVEYRGMRQAPLPPALAHLPRNELPEDAHRDAREESRMLAVRKGESLTFTLHSGGLSLRSRVLALEDGARGELIRVRLAGAQDALQARVLAPGQVEAVE